MIFFLDKDSAFTVERSLIDHAHGAFRNLLQLFKKPGGGKAVQTNLISQLGFQKKVFWNAGVGGRPSKTVDVGWALNSLRDLALGIQLKRAGLIRSLWAGPNLVVVPQDAPSLIDAPEIDRYLVPCPWVMDFYSRQAPALKSKLMIWPVGLDTDYWNDPEPSPKTNVLIYNKNQLDLSVQISKTLALKGMQTRTIHYGQYSPSDYKEALRSARAMIWLSQSETQGLACLESLSMNVPVLAWNPGTWSYHSPSLGQTFSCSASSIPYFDHRCGHSFTSEEGFSQAWDVFAEHLHDYQPRTYIFDRKLDLTSNVDWLPLPS